MNGCFLKDTWLGFERTLPVPENLSNYLDTGPDELGVALMYYANGEIPCYVSNAGERTDAK